MDQLTFTYRAPDGHRFAPGAFAPFIGDTVPVNVAEGDPLDFGDGSRVVQATLRAADVAADGRSVTITLELP